jgi:hypothetical protein
LRTPRGIRRDEHALVDDVHNAGRNDKLVVREIDAVDVSGTENEVYHSLDSGKGEEGDGSDQENGVSRIARPVQEDVDADTEEHQVDT